MVKLLLKQGAYLNHEDVNGETPLFKAVLNGHLTVIELLLERGADINHANHDGATPLFLAVLACHLPVVELLLGRGANMKHANKNGAIPLYLAAHVGDFPMFELLLDRGADVDVEPFTRMISDQESHVDISSRLAAIEAARAKAARAAAHEGHVQYFKEAVKAGVLTAPLQQWVPILPMDARVGLSTWVAASIADERACFAALFHGLSTAPLRRLSNHQGVVSKALIELLVRRSPVTRQLLRDLEGLPGRWPKYRCF